MHYFSFRLASQKTRAAVLGLTAASLFVLSACSDKNTAAETAPHIDGAIAQAPASETPASDTHASDTHASEIPASDIPVDLPTDLPAEDLAAIQSMSITQMMESATQDANQMADVLSRVNDEAAARAAMAQMKAMGPKLKAMGARIDGGLEAGEVKLSLKTMNDLADMAKAQMRMVGEMGRIAEEHPELRSIITDEFEDLEIKLE